MNTRKVLFYSLIGLAVLGLTSYLFKNPFALLRSLLTLLVFASVLVGIFYIFFRNRTESKEMRKYKQAVKQSKMRYSNSSSSQNKRKRPSYLRVIDGNKGK